MVAPIVPPFAATRLSSWSLLLRGASMIAGYVGSSKRVDEAMRHFAQAYADQIEADHQALVRAVARGRLRAARVR